MNKTYKYSIASGASKEVTFDVGVARISLQNANGEEGKTYTAGEGIAIDEQTGVISSTLTAGDGIVVNNNVISLTEDGYNVVNSLTYTTTQKKTGGKWIDGNEIYKISIPIQSPLSLPNNGVLELTLPNGISKIVNYETLFTNGTEFLAIVNNESVSVKATTSKIIITTNADYSSYTGYVTVYYTIKKAFQVLSSTPVRFDAVNSYWSTLEDDNNTGKIFVGLYSRFGDNRFCIAVMSKDSNAVTAHLKSGRSTTTYDGNITLVEHGTGIYYTTVIEPASSIPYNSNNAGIEVIFANLTDCLNAFFE